MKKPKNYQVVRVSPNGDRTIFNTVSGGYYWSKHPEYHGRKLPTDEDRKNLALEIADGWSRNGPWPESRFVVEEEMV